VGVPPTTEASRSTIWGHLSELGQRLKRCLFAFIIALVVASSVPDPFHPFGGAHAFYGYNFLVTDLIRYAENTYAPGYTIFPLSPADPVFAYINVSLVIALVGSMPFIFYELYGFVAPGLYLRERRAVRKYLLPFTILLVAGEIFGVVVIFPIVMRMLLLFYAPTGTSAFISIDNFVNLLLIIPLMSAMGFTFPKATLGRTQVGVHLGAACRQHRKPRSDGSLEHSDHHPSPRVIRGDHTRFKEGGEQQDKKSSTTSRRRTRRGTVR
jgi:sec-independent protein translocase protein TatC